jgi:hypothetical protein
LEEDLLDDGTLPPQDQELELIVVMELGSMNLAQRLEECRRQGLPAIPALELLQYMEDAAEGVDYLNRARAGRPAIIHCDIKPQNLLLVGKSVQVCDFGLAMSREARIQTSLRGFTVAYVSPEVLQNRPTVFSDQYSLAVTYYELRTGSVPFESPTVHEILSAHISGRLAFDKLGEAEQAILRRATSLNPEGRFPSCRDLVWALGARVREGLSDSAWPVPPPTDTHGTLVGKAAPPATVMRGPDVELSGTVPRPHLSRTISQARAADPCPILRRQPWTEKLLRLGRRLVSWFPTRVHSQDVGTGDVVDCTVFCQPSVHPGESILIQVFAHLPEQAAAARQLAKEFDDRSQARGFRSLATPVELGTVLMFHLNLPGLKVDEPCQALTWRRRAEAVTFGVTVPAEQRPGRLLGTVVVSLDGVPVGHIKFSLLVLTENQRASDPPMALGDSARSYQMVFISYCSEDRDEVLKRVQIIKTFRIPFFQDVLTLEPGDAWEKKLYDYIGKSDLFLLFWSMHSSASKWVRKELECALARKAGRDDLPPEIVPVILGSPIPPPPPELAHLHFNDQVLNFMTRRQV